MSFSIKLDCNVPKTTLALGGELKNTVCLLKDDVAIISETIDDLSLYDNYSKYLENIDDLLLNNATIDCIAFDLHPGYQSYKLAYTNPKWQTKSRVGIQHHKAHVASCAASENIWHNVIGLAFDGTGYGLDQTMWGGEFFKGNAKEGFERYGHFRSVGLAGNERAINQPWRIALDLALQSDCYPASIFATNDIKKFDFEIVMAILKQKKEAYTASTSLGRLFDGVAAILGICKFAEQEAQAAIALENLAGQNIAHRIYKIDVVKENLNCYELDWRPMIKEICADLKNNISSAIIAAAFHDSLAKGCAELCSLLKDSEKEVLASGGVFWNKRFSQKLSLELAKVDLKLVLPSRIVPSDAGLSLGQAVLAAFKK